ncbi:hypothetical protein ACIPSJ_51120 [Streptomyces sp. NPDC090088]
MDAGHLLPQRAQLGDRRIALGVLLRPFRLTAGPVQLGSGGDDRPGT